MIILYIRELEFWESNLKQLNSRELGKARNQSHYVVYSDASASSCGAHNIMSLNGEQICHKH
jgi:hypothetical protein